MIVGTGIDIVAVARIEAMLDDKQERFLARVYTEGEQAYCMARGRPAESLAARFAAKEAVMKVLGTGWGQGVAFPQIQVVRDANGKPGLVLAGAAEERARALGITTWHVSLSHTADQAVAMVVAESGRGQDRQGP